MNFVKRRRLKSISNWTQNYNKVKIFDIKSIFLHKTVLIKFCFLFFIFFFFKLNFIHLLTPKMHDYSSVDVLLIIYLRNSVPLIFLQLHDQPCANTPESLEILVFFFYFYYVFFLQNFFKEFFLV